MVSKYDDGVRPSCLVVVGGAVPPLTTENACTPPPTMNEVLLDLPLLPSNCSNRNVVIPLVLNKRMVQGLDGMCVCVFSL